MVAGFFEDGGLIAELGEFGLAHVVLGAGGTHLDPLFKKGDGVVGERLLGGHGGVFVFAANGVDEEGGLEIAGDHGFAHVAAFEPATGPVEEESALLLAFLLGVALVAMLDEEGADFGFEEDGAVLLLRWERVNAACHQGEAGGDDEVWKTGEWHG